MKKFLSLLAGITFLAFTSCSDDDAFKAEVEFPNETEENLMTVDAWDSEYQLSIKSNGAWRIEKYDRFIKIEPAEGMGDATVTIAVEDNRREERRYGKIRFIFDGHEDMNRDIMLEQKYAGDYDDNASSKLDDSNRIYGVGYSFNASSGEYASASALKVEVFKTDSLIKAGRLTQGPVQMRISTTQATGSSIAELSNDLAVKANCGGGFGKFKAEADASFDQSLFKNSNYEYAYTYYNAAMYEAKTEMGEEQYYECMNADAFTAINGLPRTCKLGNLEYSIIDYPTPNSKADEESFGRLIDSYGTHVIIGAQLGGRVRHSMTVDISDINTSYDIKAFASASYNGLFVSGGASVDEKFHQSLKDNQKSVKSELYVLGGSIEAARALQAKTDKESLDAWLASVDQNHMTLMAVTEVIPLWKLVVPATIRVKTADGEVVEIDGAARRKKLKEYMEGGIQGYKDYSSYDCGTVTEIEPYSNGGCGVQTVKVNGQLVAYVCNEFIPNISVDNRVQVIYPARNNKPCYNMGFFVGNTSHKPARVAWEGTNAIVQEYSDMEHARKVYLRGATITTTKPEGTESFRGELQHFMMEDMERNRYYTVKIFDQIWTSEDYEGTESTTGGNDKIEFITDDYNRYYPGSTVKKPYFAPVGWRVPKKADYAAIEAKLKASQIPLIGRQFWRNGLLGYEAYITGWWDRDRKKLVHTEDQADHITSDGAHVRIRENGSFYIGDWKDDAPLPVRFIKEW